MVQAFPPAGRYGQQILQGEVTFLHLQGDEMSMPARPMPSGIGFHMTDVTSCPVNSFFE
jgi:hypothetical protein